MDKRDSAGARGDQTAMRLRNRLNGVSLVPMAEERKKCPDRVTHGQRSAAKEAKKKKKKKVN